MLDLVHNFAAQKRKRDASLEQATDAILEVAWGSGQLLLDQGSEVQAVVIAGLPEMGLND